jgi:alkanesulfonate monooxygenase SsuD/methylene tetrahydromethanopterin reductase-like flavin-dependent oxidoreductase (luciferase family)
VIFQAGASEDGKAFAARRADAIFVSHEDIEPAKAYYKDIKARAAGFGRDPDQLHILPAARPVVGRTAEEAEALYRELTELVSLDNALSMLARPFNEYDFSQHDPDGPFPLEAAAFGANSNQSAVTRIVAAVKAENLTLRETALRFATPRGHFVGAPEQVADALQDWFEGRASDGFVLFESLPGQLEAFVDLVVPILQARGLYRTEYEGTTFRDSLGLNFPVNRYTGALQAAE